MKHCKSEIKEQILGGLPCIAECGGFLYLHETLETPEKERFPMCGVIAGNGILGQESSAALAI